MEEWTERPVDGTLELSAEQLVLLVYGRLDPARAASVKLDSEATSLDDLRAVFPGLSSGPAEALGMMGPEGVWKPPPGVRTPVSWGYAPVHEMAIHL